MSHKLEIFEELERVYSGYFKTKKDILSFIDENYPGIFADNVAIDNQILLGWDEL